MTYEIILESELATVRHNPDENYIYHTFHKQVTGQPFREIMNTGLDALKKNNVTKWLSDDRKNGEFAPEDVEFAVADWGPRAADAGWEYWALVVPESMAGRVGMRGIVNTFFELGVRVSIFTDLDEAREWLVEL